MDNDCKCYGIRHKGDCLVGNIVSNTPVPLVIPAIDLLRQPKPAKVKFVRGSVKRSQKSLSVQLAKLSVHAKTLQSVTPLTSREIRKANRQITHLERKIATQCQTAETNLREQDYLTIANDYRSSLEYCSPKTVKWYCVTCKHAFSKRENKALAKTINRVCKRCNSHDVRQIDLLGKVVSRTELPHDD